MPCYLTPFSTRSACSALQNCEVHNTLSLYQCQKSKSMEILMNAAAMNIFWLSALQNELQHHTTMTTVLHNMD